MPCPALPWLRCAALSRPRVSRQTPLFSVWTRLGPTGGRASIHRSLNIQRLHARHTASSQAPSQHPARPLTIARGYAIRGPSSQWTMDITRPSTCSHDTPWNPDASSRSIKEGLHPRSLSSRSLSMCVSGASTPPPEHCCCSWWEAYLELSPNTAAHDNVDSRSQACSRRTQHGVRCHATDDSFPC